MFKDVYNFSKFDVVKNYNDDIISPSMRQGENSDVSCQTSGTRS